MLRSALLTVGPVYWYTSPARMPVTTSTFWPLVSVVVDGSSIEVWLWLTLVAVRVVADVVAGDRDADGDADGEPADAARDGRGGDMGGDAPGGGREHGEPGPPVTVVLAMYACVALRITFSALAPAPASVRAPMPPAIATATP